MEEKEKSAQGFTANQLREADELFFAFYKQVAFVPGALASVMVIKENAPCACHLHFRTFIYHNQ